MIITNPITLLLYFIGLGLDIVVFFLIVRLLLNWREIPWLDAFNHVGKPIVDYLTDIVGEYFYVKHQKMLSVNSKIWLSLSFISILRFFSLGLIHLF